LTGALTKAAVGVALLALGGCQTAKEQVHMRLTSPDGAYEAVLMVCQTPSDFTSNDLVVAVFGEKGRDCDKPYVHAVTAARLTHTYGADDPKATIRWDGQTLAKATRAQNGIELEIIGRAEILAQTPINVIGLRPELSGQWITETAEHTADFTGAGFTSRITARRKSETRT